MLERTRNKHKSRQVNGSRYCGYSGFNTLTKQTGQSLRCKPACSLTVLTATYVVLSQIAIHRDLMNTGMFQGTLQYFQLFLQPLPRNYHYVISRTGVFNVILPFCHRKRNDFVHLFQEVFSLQWQVWLLKWQVPATPIVKVGKICQDDITWAHGF